MPRIKLQEPPGYEFRYEVTVQFRDINQAKHLGADSIISMTNGAMMNVFRCLGITDEKLGDNKTGMIMVDLGANYKSEGRMFDVLQIDSHVEVANRNSFRIFHRVARSGEVLALVDTGFLAFDYAIGKPVAIPREFLQILDEWRMKNSHQI
jgi:acyl-CoA thioesterase FadM